MYNHEAARKLLSFVASEINALSKGYTAYVRDDSSGLPALRIAESSAFRTPIVRFASSGSMRLVWGERAYKWPATCAAAIVRFMDSNAAEREAQRVADEAARAAIGPKFTNVLHVGLKK